MSESAARGYIVHATEALKEPGTRFSAAEKALIYASLAQVEATLEVVDALRKGLRIGYAEELTHALNRLARRLPDR
jgi:hypothetical protein